MVGSRRCSLPGARAGHTRGNRVVLDWVARRLRQALVIAAAQHSLEASVRSAFLWFRRRRRESSLYVYLDSERENA